MWKMENTAHGRLSETNSPAIQQDSRRIRYWGGSTIYINPVLIGASLVGNESLLFHEALHELGLIDSTIQEALGLTVDDKNTRNITTKLNSDCVTGKGNN